MESENTPFGYLLRRAHEELNEADHRPFSQRGFLTLQEKISEYIVQLISEAARSAKRHRGDTISVADVESAAEYLVASTGRRVFKHLGTIGGILLGASLSTFQGIAVAWNPQNPPAIKGLLLAAGMAVAGSFMIALHIAKE